MKRLFNLVIMSKREFELNESYEQCLENQNKEFAQELSDLKDFNEECVTNIQTLKQKLHALKRPPRNAKGQFMKREDYI